MPAVNTGYFSPLLLKRRWIWHLHVFHTLLVTQWFLLLSILQIRRESWPLNGGKLRETMRVLSSFLEYFGSTEEEVPN